MVLLETAPTASASGRSGLQVWCAFAETGWDECENVEMTAAEAR